MNNDKIIIIKDGKVKEIEGKLLHLTEKAGFLDDTTKFDSYRRRIPDGIVRHTFIEILTNKRSDVLWQS